MHYWGLYVHERVFLSGNGMFQVGFQNIRFYSIYSLVECLSLLKQPPFPLISLKRKKNEYRYFGQQVNKGFQKY